MNPAAMVWQLMRRDPALRMTTWLTPGVAAICVLSHFFAPAETDGDPSIFLLLAIFGLLFAGLAAVFTQSSDTDFQATMPVSVRQFFLSRMLSMATMMLLPVAAGVAMLTALKDPVTADLPLEMWTLFTCTLLGIQCFAIRRNIRQWLIIILLPAWAFICAVAGVGDLGAAVAARVVCWGIIAAVVLRTWQVLPPSFQDAQMEMAAALPVRRATANRTSGALSWKTWLHIALLTSGWMFIPIFAAVIIAGASNPFVFILLGLQWPAIGPRLRWLFTLPVSPRVLICAAALPMLLAICSGYALNIRLPWIPVDNIRAVSKPDCETPNVLPSPQYLIPVRSGKPPLIKAPWGETFHPPINRVMGFDVYDPYAVGCDNSHRFFEWQLNRASVATHGRPGLRTQAVNIASLMAFSLLSLLIAMTLDWRLMRRLPDVVRVRAKWLVGAAAAALLMWISFGRIDVIQWLSWTLPAGTVAAIAVESAVIALLLLGIDTLFRQLEFTDKPVGGAS